ncbi:MAG: SH3 domain-containing protein [Gemmatimonadales bacterium]
MPFHHARAPLVLFLLLGCALSRADAQVLRVTRNVNLRPSPSTELPPLRTLLPGEVVTPLDLEPTDRYYNVLTADGEEGWLWAPNVVLEAMPPEIPPYRRADWRHWVDDDRNCRNARTEVLVRQALSVTLATRADGRQCAVTGGVWVDPFSGDTIRSPGQLDIDHIVPLQNAHLSGGWAWTAERRRAFANDLADTLHLLAVTARLNRQKGAQGPGTWLPPDTTFSCTYVGAWEGIKRRWGLTMTVRERAAVDSVRRVRGCG